MATYASRYKPSDDVKKRQQAYESYTAQKPTYESRYQADIDALRDSIQNRDAFNYNVNEDALYQQLKDQYVQQGRMAMMDTMGQAAGLTGGYGSSYGQMAGQQAYQGYLQGLNDQIPDLYGMALDRYIAEGDAMLQNYGMMLDQEAMDYGRYQDQYNAWQNEYNRLYGEYQDALSADYSMYRDNVEDDKWQTEYDEALRQYNAALSAAGGSGGGSGGAGSGSGSGSVSDGKDDKTTANTGRRIDSVTLPELTYDNGMTESEIAQAAAEYFDENPDVGLDSRTLSNWLSANGYTSADGSADLFKAYLQMAGAGYTYSSPKPKAPTKGGGTNTNSFMTR